MTEPEEEEWVVRHITPMSDLPIMQAQPNVPSKWYSVDAKIVIVALLGVRISKFLGVISDR